MNCCLQLSVFFRDNNLLAKKTIELGKAKGVHVALQIDQNQVITFNFEFDEKGRAPQYIKFKDLKVLLHLISFNLMMCSLLEVPTPNRIPYSRIDWYLRTEKFLLAKFQRQGTAKMCGKSLHGTSATKRKTKN